MSSQTKSNSNAFIPPRGMHTRKKFNFDKKANIYHQIKIQFQEISFHQIALKREIRTNTIKKKVNE